MADVGRWLGNRRRPLFSQRFLSCASVSCARACLSAAVLVNREFCPPIAGVRGGTDDPVPSLDGVPSPLVPWVSLYAPLSSRERAFPWSCRPPPGGRYPSDRRPTSRGVRHILFNVEDVSELRRHLLFNLEEEEDARGGWLGVCAGTLGSPALTPDHTSEPEDRT